MYSKILVPTDGSALSDQAAAAAVEFARGIGAQVVALSIAQPYPALGAETPVVIDTSAENSAVMEAAQQHVDKVAQVAKAAGVACLTVTALATSPHDEIIRVAEANQCDLIFMASHGRRGLSRLFAGSVTQNVLAHSSIPVLVLRPPGMH